MLLFFFPSCFLIRLFAKVCDDVEEKKSFVIFPNKLELNVNIKGKQEHNITQQQQKQQGNSTNDILLECYSVYKYYQKQYEKQKNVKVGV